MKSYNWLVGQSLMVKGTGEVKKIKSVFENTESSEEFGNYKVLTEDDMYFYENEIDIVRAKIISAFPGCGKSTYYKEWSQYSPENNWRKDNNGEQVYRSDGSIVGEKILDSDSSLFSWIYDEHNCKTSVRHPDFPNNYIEHIKEKMLTEDIIFVSSHEVVRKALEENNIPYILVYPKRDRKDEWLTRFERRGNDDKFIAFQDEHWDEFIDQMEAETFPQKIVLDWYENGYDGICVSMINDIMGCCDVVYKEPSNDSEE